MPIGVVWVVYEGKGAKSPMHHLVKVVGSKRDGYRAVGFWMSATPDGRPRMPIPPELSGDILDSATPR